MPDEIDYFWGKLPDKIYVSRAFDGRKRFMSKVFDFPESYQIADVKDEVVLRVTPGGRQEVKALFYEDTRGIEALTIQKFGTKTENPHKWFFTFHDEEVGKLYNLLRVIKYMKLESEGKERFDDNIFDDLSIPEEEILRYMREHPKLVIEIARNNITESDITALAYRKEQLELFGNLLHNEHFFEKTRIEQGKGEAKLAKPETVWQKFFEKNTWIFGYGLSYIFTSNLDDQKLEQVTTGYSISGAGKRVDALMKTRGLISSLCFVEIKTHKTSLLSKTPYRRECWPISDELAGGISQIQKTVQKAINNIQTKHDVETDTGEPTGETVFLYQPRAFVVVGSLDEFRTNQKTNEQRFSSFELFRRNMVNPEIITFDELFERARFIVRHSEDEESFAEEDDDAGMDIAADDDIPF